MSESYLNVKILKKDKDLNFKIKRFPIMIGKGKAKNIIPVNGDGVELKHGIFHRKGNKIFYEDTSRNGTRVNGRLIVKEKTSLIKGVNEIQIGRYRIIIQNTYSSNGSSTNIGTRKSKQRLYIFIPIIILLIAAASFVFYNLLFKVKTIELNDFHLTPTPLSPYNQVELRLSHFNEEVSLEEEIIYNLYFNTKGKETTDTLMLKHVYGDESPIKFNLPTGLIDKGVNESRINVRLELISNRYKFVPILEKRHLVSIKEKHETKNGITLRTKISGPVFEYELSNKLNSIKNIKADFGDRSPIQHSIKRVYLYERQGEYKFSIEVEHDSKKIQFERKVIVE